MLARVIVATLAAGAALGAPATAQTPAPAAIQHFPLPNQSLAVVQGQDRLIVATSTSGGGLAVTTQGFDGSAVQTLARLPVPAGRKGYSVAAVAATPTTWVLGWRVVRTYSGDEDTYNFIQSEQIVTGSMSGGTPKVLSHCTAGKAIDDLGEEGVTADLTVVADGGRIAWGAAVCPGAAGLSTWTRAAGVKHISGVGSAPLLAGRYLAYTHRARKRTDLMLVSAATGRALRSTPVDLYTGVFAALASDGTLVAIGGAGRRSSALTVTTPTQATRTLLRVAVHGSAAVFGGRVVYTATDGHLTTMALAAGSDPATPLPSDLPASQHLVGYYNAVLGLDAHRVISRDTTCTGSELTITPLDAAAPMTLLPAECPVSFVTTDVQATAAGGVPVTVSCSLGCSGVRVVLFDAKGNVVGAGDVSAPPGATASVTVKPTAEIRRQLSQGPLVLRVSADNYGRDGVAHEYPGSLSVHP